MNKVEKYIKQLFDSRKMDSDDEFELFEDAVANLADLATIEDIPMLCKAFDDSTEENEVMFGLVHLVEQFGGEKSIRLILHGILDIMNHSPEWAKILIRRILNDNTSRKFFGFELKELNEVVKSDVCELLDDIKNENPEKFKEKVEEVLNF